MTDTRGEGIMSSVFEKYEPVKGDIPHRNVGAMICFETGTSTSYGLFYAQERGTLFIGAGQEVYGGMICGQNAHNMDLAVNVCYKILEGTPYSYVWSHRMALLEQPVLGTSDVPGTASALPF